MASLNALTAYYGNERPIGKQIKAISDRVMDQTWDLDVATRQCYLYDVYHDDLDTRNTIKLGYNYSPPEGSQKIPVMLKFMVKQYKSLAKDQPEYHIMFPPEEWNKVQVEDESLVPDWWYSYSSLGVSFPIGLYVDIPNDKGVYYRWLIMYEDVANQFPKFGVIRCNYIFDWVTNKPQGRFLRHMPGVQRSQNSYNSGLWTDTYTTRVENQTKGWLPWNPITAELYYNQRLVISMPLDTPITWKISKVQNTKPKGIQSLTFFQDRWNDDTDYIDKSDPIIWKMYADYFTTNTGEPEEAPDIPDEPQGIIKVSSASTVIKVNGSYKTLKMECFDIYGDPMDAPGEYTWEFAIGEEDASSLVEILQGTSAGKVRIKFLGDESYIGKVLVITVTSGNLTGNFSCDIVAI